MKILYEPSAEEMILSMYADINVSGDEINYPITRKISSIEDIRKCFSFGYRQDMESELMFINHLPYRKSIRNNVKLPIDLSLIRIYIIKEDILSMRGINWKISYEHDKMSLTCITKLIDKHFINNCTALLYCTLSYMLKLSNVKSYIINYDDSNIVIEF